MSGRNRLRLVIGTILAASVIGVPLGSSPVQAATSPQFSGVITDHDSGDPIAGACVDFYSNVDVRRGTACTDASGAYAISGFMLGSYRLKVRAAGYPDMWWPDRPTFATAVGVLVGSYTFTKTADVEMRSHVGTIAGQITDPTGGNRASNVMVDVNSTDGSWKRTFWTLNDGSFTAPSVPSGAYHIRIKNPVNVGEQWIPGAGAETGATAIVVSDGAITTVSDTLVEGFGTYSKLRFFGHITDRSSGEAVAGATVTIFSNLGVMLASVQTGASGDYAALDVGVGWSERLRVSAPGYADQWYGGSPTIDSAVQGSGTAPSGVKENFQLSPPAHLDGKITDADGNGVATSVTLSDSSNTYAKIYSSPDGTFDLPNARPGSYRVAYASPLWGTQWNSGAVTAETATPVSLVTGATTHLSEQYASRASARIVVTDSVSGAPVTDVCLTATTPHLQGQGQACNAADGVYVLDGLPPGSTTIKLALGASHHAQVADQVYTAIAGQQFTAPLHLLPTGSIAVPTPAQADGSSPAMCVTAVPVGGSPNVPVRFSTCVPAGLASVQLDNLPLGRYMIFVKPAAPFGAQWLGTNGGTGDQRLAARISTMPETVVTAPTLRLDKAGSIKGWVDIPPQAPYTSAEVSPVGLPIGVSGEFPSTGASLYDAGRYQLDGLGPYEWPMQFTLHASGVGWSGGATDRFSAWTTQVKSGVAVSIGGNPVRTGGSLNISPASHLLTVVSAVTGDVVATGVWASSGLPAGWFIVHDDTLNCWYRANGPIPGYAPYVRAGMSITIVAGRNCTPGMPGLLGPRSAIRALTVVQQAAASGIGDTAATGSTATAAGPIGTIVSAVSRAGASAFAAVADRQR